MALALVSSWNCLSSSHSDLDWSRHSRLDPHFMRSTCYIWNLVLYLKTRKTWHKALITKVKEHSGSLVYFSGPFPTLNLLVEMQLTIFSRSTTWLLTSRRKFYSLTSWFWGLNMGHVYNGLYHWAVTPNLTDTDFVIQLNLSSSSLVFSSSFV